MVDLSERNGMARASLDRASRAIADALAEGVAEHELVNMVTTVAADRVAEQHEIPGLFPDPEPIYTDTEVPAGLIDLRSAATKYGYRLRTLQMWVHRGHLKVCGRLRAPAPGRGYLLVSEEALRDRINSPVNKGGRPRRTTLPR